MSRSTSLAIVSGAVAGDGLERVARSASEALGHPVAVICPSADAPVVWPAEAVPAGRLDELAAAAKAIVQLMADGADADEALAVDEAAPESVIAELGAKWLVGLVPLAGDSERQAGALAERLRGAGWRVGVSAPRGQPTQLHEAVREAMLVAEVSSVPDTAFVGQEETYRLLIGVLLREPAELELLRAHTIAPLLAYDAEHGTELLVTLGTFLAHDGSTTETAEAMQLHRHTVGYRLSRVQEVSGLSPYESDGRERLSLGLKAAHILAAQERLSQPG